MKSFSFKSLIVNLIRIILPICLIVAGMAGWKYFKSTEPEMKRRPPQKTMLTVETAKFAKMDYQGKIQGMGTVVPAGQIALKSRVSGEVVSVSKDFSRGAVVKKGQVLCRIDDTDYQIELEKVKSALEKTLSDLALEEGSQKVAKEEFKLIHKASNGEIESTDLALRKPQLAQAQAAVKTVRADLKKAELNLERTVIRAPFNGLVLEKKVDPGALVSSQEILATLVDVDKFYVETLISPGQIRYLKAGESQGSRAVVRSAYDGRTWQGRLEKFTGEIASDSRMAGVLVAVYDPMGKENDSTGPGLMLNDYVSVELFGRTLANVTALPRKWLRDNETVWIYRDGRLEIKPVRVIWKEKETVYVNDGVNPEDEVIVSDIPAPVSGMSLVRSEDPDNNESKSLRTEKPDDSAKAQRNRS